MRAESSTQMASALAENIRDLTARRTAEAREAPLSERIAERVTRFTGSMTFVALHLIVYGTWILINLGWLPLVEPFDPTFVVLAMEASVEAIFLSTFVLISQNRMAASADERADLDLHINLLAEHELTKLAQLVERIAERLDVAIDDPQIQEIKQTIDPGEVLDALDQQRRAEGQRAG